ncbi:hypothetical protein GOBAR_AA26234 [Gossypium barbadense]|uniref:EF-hand domain-containing protein n=1 Tax=Gossypium barbadense TaxID=3634 RepID=A0A2P5WTP6_GOSBA|nr:hypothetical protein GOBAR_AA26234 [Gossypium barbadense]
MVMSIELLWISVFRMLMSSQRLRIYNSRWHQRALRCQWRSSLVDLDGNGYITAAELAHSMAKLGHALTAEELTGMIKEADTDGDGMISFEEFSNAITSAAFDNSWG